MLQGSFDTVSLDEVLGFLASSSKSGVLRISGDRGTGAVWVEDGQISGADATHGGDDATLEEVMFELLRFSSGSFSFDFDESNPNGGTPAPVETVLAQANKLLVEWRGIELVVPGLDYRVTPNPTLPADQMTITDDEWSTILAIGPSSTVEEMSHTLGMSELPSLRRLKGLIERRLVLLSAPPEDAPSSEAPAKDAFRTAHAAVSDDADVDSAQYDSAQYDSAQYDAGYDAADLVVPTSQPVSTPQTGSSDQPLSARRGSVENSTRPRADDLTDPFAVGEQRPPQPPPPPIPTSSGSSSGASSSSASVPPPPAPPSPAEIAKFGTSVEDPSTIDEASDSDRDSLLMRYLQSES